MLFKKASGSLSDRDGLDAASEWAEGCGVQLLFYLNFLGISNPRVIEEPAKYHKNIYEWTHLGQNEMDTILSFIVIKISNVLLGSLFDKKDNNHSNTRTGVDGMTITQTQDIFFLVDAAWKHPKYPCFCILPLGFEVNIDIHKHENSEFIYSNHNKSPTDMSGNSRLRKHEKHVNRFHLNVQAIYLIPRILYHFKWYVALWKWPKCPSTCREAAGKLWQQ